MYTYSAMAFPIQRAPNVLLALLLVLFTGTSAGLCLHAATFLRGDTSADGGLELTDAVRIFGFLFLGSPETLGCEDIADVDDNGELAITDGIYLLNFLFNGGPEPPPPFPDPGTDPTTADPFLCGDTSSGALEGPPPFDFSVEAGTQVSQVVSAQAGGTVTALGSVAMTLELPPGALSEDTEVSLSVMSDAVNGPFALMGLFEPDGLSLLVPATLVISLSVPLPQGQVLHIVESPSSDAAALIDTGTVAEVSQDRSTVRIPVEHFSAIGCKLNCHAHALRRILEGLVDRRGMSKEGIINEMCTSVGGELLSTLEPGVQVSEKAVMDSCFTEGGVVHQQLGETFEQLRGIETTKNFVHCDAPAWLLLAYLNTFYSLEPARLDPERNADGTVKTDAKDTALLEPTDEACLDNLETLTLASDLPPVLNFGRRFTVNGQPDENLSAEDTPVFYDVVAHSAALVPRGGNIVIENGAVLSANAAIVLAGSRLEHPERSAEEVPRVIAVPLDELDDAIRRPRSGEAVRDELVKWGVTDEAFLRELVPGGTDFPWPAVRIWVPRGTPPGTCPKEEFSAAYTGTGTYTITKSADWGQKGSAECTSTATWRITLSGDGTLSAENTISKSASHSVTENGGRVSCVDSVATRTFSGTHSGGRFQFVANTLFPGDPVTGTYDSQNLRTEPQIWRIEDDVIYPYGTLHWSESHEFALTAE